MRPMGHPHRRRRNRRPPRPRPLLRQQPLDAPHRCRSRPPARHRLERRQRQTHGRLPHRLPRPRHQKPQPLPRAPPRHALFRHHRLPPPLRHPPVSNKKTRSSSACFIAFFFSPTGNAYLAFPRASVLAFKPSPPPLTRRRRLLPRQAAHPTLIYPGQGGYFLSRALPIDFIVAGIPGAILGYYAAFRWSLTSHEPKA